MGVRGENNRFLQPEAITDSWQGSRAVPVSGCSPRNGQRFPRKGTRVWKTPGKGGNQSGASKSGAAVPCAGQRLQGAGEQLWPVPANARTAVQCNGAKQALVRRAPGWEAHSCAAFVSLSHPRRSHPALLSGFTSPLLRWKFPSAAASVEDWNRNPISLLSKQTITRGVIIGAMMASVTTVLLGIIISCCNFNIVLAV